MAGAFDPTAPGFDVTAMVPTPGAPAPSQPPAGEDRKKWLRLIPIVAAAARGGPGALEGVMQGLQQAQLLKQQQATQDAATQRQTMLDQQTLQQQQHQRQYQTGQLDAERARNSSALMKQFTEALNAAEDPEAVRALTEMYESQGRQFGIRPGLFQTTAMQVVKPDQLKQRKIAKRWSGMSVEEKKLAQQTQASLTIDGEVIPYQQWSASVGGLIDPKTGAFPQVPKTAAARALQSKEVMVNGRRMFANFDPDDGKFYDQSGQEVQGAAPIPPVSLLQPSAGGLPDRVQRRVDAQAKGFDAQPVVKRTQTMAEAVSFANSIDPNTTNPADDQALIYAFAKAMDPDSVVREGEYATVQKYAQSWAERFGFNAARIFSNTQFLTPQARANMKSTIQQRYTAAKGQYDNVRAQYAQRINGITGGTDGEQHLIDYGAAFPAVTTQQEQPGGATVGGNVPNPFRR